MTFQKMLDGLEMGLLDPKDVYKTLEKKDYMQKINFYGHIANSNGVTLDDAQLSELRSIVGVTQILYNSGEGSPISDYLYDSLQEMLVNYGIPRLSGSVEINDSKKVSHTYTNLRGTLGKVYYLTDDEPRTNKSRRSLDEWINSIAQIYVRKTGEKINWDDVKVLVQSKYDGVSAIMQYDGTNTIWLSRGDTTNNRASDISRVMRVFNDVYREDEPCGVKFEVMMSEEGKDSINKLISGKPYKNSRQIVSATINSVEPDFKVDYLYPVPLRIMYPRDEVEQIHPLMIEKFPTMFCTLGDRDKIREFANTHRYVKLPNVTLRTDGAVITILDPKIQKVLGRENNINNFEIAYKFTEEFAYTKVKGVEFYVSEFSHITPVLVVQDVILKGNTINHISLSNKERFDELDLHVGDTVKVWYDIIPYVTIDENCPRGNGRPIKFIDKCPRCGAPLDLYTNDVQCTSPECPSKKIGVVLNYCKCLRIKNIGYSMVEDLYDAGLLKHGVRSLYKLSKKANTIMDLDGFGQLKTRKLINEIESKRRLKDYEFFGALGIEGLSMKTFQSIFQQVKLDDFLNMIWTQNTKLLYAKLLTINGIGEAKADLIYEYFKNGHNRSELEKLLKEVTLVQTYSEGQTPNGRIVFTGCRPDDELREHLEGLGYEVSDTWSNSCKMLVVPNLEYTSSKVNKANARNIKIITIEEARNL